MAAFIFVLKLREVYVAGTRSPETREFRDYNCQVTECV
jgi:hypothetical protein